jgi:preprotein translocase subunit SecB
MDKSRQPGLLIDQIFLLSAHLEHRQDALSLPPTTRVDADVKIDVAVGLSEDNSRGILTITVSTVEAEPGPLYRFQVAMCALVRADESAPNLPVNEYLTKQGAPSMYPFLREAVANLTGRGRFGPMWLKPLNLTAPDVEAKEEAPQA